MKNIFVKFPQWYNNPDISVNNHNSLLFKDQTICTSCRRKELKFQRTALQDLVWTDRSNEIEEFKSYVSIIFGYFIPKKKDLLQKQFDTEEKEDWAFNFGYFLPNKSTFVANYFHYNCIFCKYPKHFFMYIFSWINLVALLSLHNFPKIYSRTLIYKYY